MLDASNPEPSSKKKKQASSRPSNARFWPPTLVAKASTGLASKSSTNLNTSNKNSDTTVKNNSNSVDFICKQTQSNLKRDKPKEEIDNGDDDEDEDDDNDEDDDELEELDLQKELNASLPPNLHPFEVDDMMS